MKDVVYMKKKKNFDLRIILSIGSIVTLICSYFLYNKFIYNSNKYFLLIILFLFFIVCAITYKFTVTYIVKNKSKLLDYLLFIVIGLCFCFSFFYGFKSCVLFKYNNDLDVVVMSDTFSIKKSKLLVKEINKYFEEKQTFLSRKISINKCFLSKDMGKNTYSINFDNYNKAYTLRFYFEEVNNKIKNLFWINENDEKFYLIDDFKKTDNFDYYYAVAILDVALGEQSEVDKSFDKMVEEKVSKEFDDSKFVIVSYDQIVFDKENNQFSINSSVNSMDGIGNMKSKNFVIKIKKVNNVLEDFKNVNYYNDYSFNYLEWEINYL